MTRALTISTDGTVRALEVTSLADLQAAVGGYIEGIGLDERVLLYCHEEAKLTAEPVPNLVATALVNRFHPGFVQRDFIAGNVVIVGCQNARGRNDGDDHDVPEAAEKLVNSIAAYVRSEAEARGVTLP